MICIASYQKAIIFGFDGEKWFKTVKRTFNKIGLSFENRWASRTGPVGYLSLGRFSAGIYLFEEKTYIWKCELREEWSKTLGDCNRGVGIDNEKLDMF